MKIPVECVSFVSMLLNIIPVTFFETAEAVDVCGCVDGDWDMFEKTKQFWRLFLNRKNLKISKSQISPRSH